MKDNKCRIFLMYIFRLIMAINLPKFALISQIFLKFYHFLVFSTFFFAKMWVDWDVIWFFQRIKTNSSNFCLKSYIWLNIWTK